MKDKQIKATLSGNLPIKIKFTKFLVNLKKYIIHFKRGKFKGLKNIEGLQDYDIPADLFSPKNRKNGISGFARLRNGGEFLEQVIESHIPYMNEIILVDNNSGDNTREICEKMQKKYPKIIKIYKYEPDVYKLGTQEYAEVLENSVHDMSYYYNWVLSKTTYKYAIKIDDDHIVIPEVLEKITNSIKKYGLNKFVSVGLYNIIQKGNDLFLPTNAPFAGLFGDFGFFPVSENTYFIKDEKCENFIHNLKATYCGLGFFHLKFLKKSLGVVNYEGKIKTMVLSQTQGKLYKLPSKITKLFFTFFKEK